MVGENYGSITGTTKDNQTMTAKELGVSDARIRWQKGSDSGYLTLYGLDSYGKVFELEGAGGADVPAMFFGNLSDLAGDLTAYSFVLELGNYQGGSWVHTSMESVAASYDDRMQAAQGRDDFKAKHPNNADFQKAWLLYNVK
jgi:hypothetical protein